MLVKTIRHLLLAISVACHASAQNLSNSASPSTASDTLPASVLAWTEDSKVRAAKTGEVSLSLTYEAANVSSDEVTITKLLPSCGCTLVETPPLPWKLAPKSRAVIPVKIDLRGKRGILAKDVTVETSHGRKILRFRIEIPPGAPMLSPVTEFREQNLKVAASDPQAIFKNTCANCHSSPARGKMGRELYQAACAICHNSPNRAEMVPALDALPHPTDLAFWKLAVSGGKPGTLMPAFAVDQGGPLTPEQIASLAQYLADSIPSPAKAE